MDKVFYFERARFCINIGQYSVIIYDNLTGTQIARGIDNYNKIIWIYDDEQYHKWLTPNLVSFCNKIVNNQAFI